MEYLKLIRIKHWIKNFLIFVPMLCARVINLNNIYVIILGFFSFCFASSFIYIMNDIKDIEKDKLHPVKKNRPLASGKITKRNGIILSVIMLVISLALSILAQKKIISSSLIILLSYIVINIFYSFELKNYAIIDVVLLTAGFVLRVYYGAALLNIVVSSWLFLTVMSGALFLGLGKRKKELINHKDVRTSLEEYNENFLDKFQYTCLSLTLVFYSLWAMEQDIKYILYTIPMVVTIFMRYCLVVEKNTEGDPATILYSDKILMGLCVIFAAFITLIMVVL